MQEFAIPSMSCGGCASRITQTIKNLDTDAKIEVDLANKTVRIDSSQQRASVAAALKEAGYPPVEIQTGASSAATRAEPARGGGCC